MNIACMAKEFLHCSAGKLQLFARPYAIDAEPGLSCFAQVRLHCAESRLDRIEVGRVRWQIEQRGRWVGQLDI